MGLEVGERRSAVVPAGEMPLTEEEAIALLLKGEEGSGGPTGVIEPFIVGTHSHTMRARPEQLAKRRAKNKSAKQSRKINRRKK